MEQQVEEQEEQDHLQQDILRQAKVELEYRVVLQEVH